VLRLRFIALVQELGSNSPTFYEQLLHTQIPKSTKKTDGLTVFFALLGSSLIKAARKMLMKLTPEGGEKIKFI